MGNSKQKPLISLALTLGVAAVLLIPAAAFVFLRWSDDAPALRVDQPVAGQEETPKSGGRKASGSRLFQGFGSGVGNRPQRQLTAVVKEPVIQQPATQIAVRPFPLTANVPIGMEKSKLIASFGAPNMVTTEVTDGRPLETMRYLRPETGTETVIFLRSGRVVSATSNNY